MHRRDLLTLLRSTPFTAIVILASQGKAVAVLAEPVRVGDAMQDVRNARYCEIIPVVRVLKATVYNTLGHNDCPAKIWDGITESAMKERFGALMVLMNGPRYSSWMRSALRARARRRHGAD